MKMLYEYQLKIANWYNLPTGNVTELVPKWLLLLQEVTFGAQKIMHHSEKPSYILGNKSF